MRQEALDYQIEHQGKDDSHNAMMGELDCLAALSILDKGNSEVCQSCPPPAK